MPPGRHILCAVQAILLFASAEARADDLGFANPTTQTYRLLIDATVEDPPRYNGVGAVPRPAAGDSVSFQVYMPAAAGLEAFAYQLAFSDTGRVFSDHFEILDARTDARPLREAGSGGPSGFRVLRLDGPRGSGGPQRGALLMTPWRVSNTGLIAVVKLLAKKDVPRNLDLTLNVDITVISKTPRTRLLIMVGAQDIVWRGTP